MDAEQPQTALVPRSVDLEVALKSAISLWASATTGESERLRDLLREALVQIAVTGYAEATQAFTSRGSY
jgi:hypothetical protein